MKTLSRTLPILLAVSMPLSALAATFSDIPSGHWAKKAVNSAVEMGLISGMTDGTFKGGKDLTRAHFANVLIKMIKQLETAAGTDLHRPSLGALQFTDLVNYPGEAPRIVELNNLYGAFDGWSGVAGGTFEPNKPVTRYEAAMALNNILKTAELKGAIKPMATDEVAVPFSDVDQAHADAVQKVWHRYGVMSGMPDNTFKGNAALNRYQFAQLAVNALNAMKAMATKPAPQPQPTAAPTAEPTAAPTPEPTPVEPAIIPNYNELSGAFGLIPNSTLTSALSFVPNTTQVGENMVVGNLQLGQPIGDFFIAERLRTYWSNAAAVTAGNLNTQLGLGVGYRFRLTDNFHLVPQVGADAWTPVTGWTGINNTALSANGRLGLEWWIVPEFSIGLGAEANYGIPGGAFAWGGGTTTDIGGNLFYGGDLRLRWFPVKCFGIQLGALGLPTPNGKTAQNWAVVPNAGITWAW